MGATASGFIHSFQSTLEHKKESNVIAKVGKTKCQTGHILLSCMTSFLIHTVSTTSCLEPVMNCRPLVAVRVIANTTETSQ